MFPKRKLDETRSASQSPKEEPEAKDEQGHLSKRPRVESTASSAGTLHLCSSTGCENKKSANTFSSTNICAKKDGN